MPQLKNNHTIPKCLIKEWAVSGKNYNGVHVYEYDEDKVHFSSSRGPRGFSFAIEPNIYVAQTESERIVTVERWLAGIENTMNIFLRQVKLGGGEYLVKDKKNFDLLLLSLFSLRHRSKYYLQNIHKFLTVNPDYKKEIGDEEIDNTILVLENFIHCTTEDAMRHENCEIIIAKNHRGNLILGDRPFLFNVNQTEYSFLPVTPNHLISFRKINEPSYYHVVEDALTDEMVDSFNRMVASYSRQWIVAKTEDLLNRYIPDCKVPREDETPFFEPVQKLRWGYKLRSK